MNASNDGEDELNGLIFNSHFLPEEIVSYILSYIPPKSLLRCRRVCKTWLYIIDENVWKILTRRYANKLQSFSKISHAERITLNFPPYLYYSIFTEDPFERNLVKNNCGQAKLKFWTLSKSDSRRRLGDGFWEIEPEPLGADPLPESDDFQGCKSCFATSYLRCAKKQLIMLKTFGISDVIMDEYQPTITASEWYAGRFDCGCVYELTVSLLNEDKEVMHEKGGEPKIILQWQGRKWEKVEYSFTNYGKGVRYIEFAHMGKDTQFWAGHYGSKMSGAVVKISLPKSKNIDSA